MTNKSITSSNESQNPRWAHSRGLICWALLGPGPCLGHSFVGPCWAPGPVGAIHLLDPVGPLALLGPFMCWALLGPGPCWGHSCVGPSWPCWGHLGKYSLNSFLFKERHVQPKTIAVPGLGGIPSIPPSPLVSILGSSLHPPIRDFYNNYV